MVSRQLSSWPSSSCQASVWKCKIHKNKIRKQIFATYISGRKKEENCKQSICYMYVLAALLWYLCQILFFYDGIFVSCTVLYPFLCNNQFTCFKFVKMCIHQPRTATHTHWHTQQYVICGYNCLYHIVHNIMVGK